MDALPKEEEKKGLAQLYKNPNVNENGQLIPHAPYQPATKDMWEHCKNFVDIPGGTKGEVTPGCLTWAADIKKQCDEALKPLEGNK